jgi:hypothetical protein
MKGKQKHRPVSAVYRLPLAGTEESKQTKSKLERRPHGGRFAPPPGSSFNENMLPLRKAINGQRPVAR